MEVLQEHEADVTEEEHLLEVKALVKESISAKDTINEHGLLQKLDDLRVKNPKDTEKSELERWMNTNAVTSSYSLSGTLENKKDDLEREAKIYKQTLENVMIARDNYRRLNVPWTRPSDYFAEMIKSDQHMQKIKRKILREKRLMDEKEQRQQQRAMLKYGKHVQKVKEMEKASKKKQNIEAIKQWRKAREKGGQNDEELPDFLENAKAAAKSKKMAKSSEPSTKSNKNRKMTKAEYKKMKYGYGNRIHHFRQKYNTAESVDDFSFNFKANNIRDGHSIKKRSAAAVFNNKKRPGKKRRQTK